MYKAKPQTCVRITFGEYRHVAVLIGWELIHQRDMMIPQHMALAMNY